MDAPAGRNALDRPAPLLSPRDAAIVVVGIVVGAGIFRAPSVVAANTTSDVAMLLAWLAGGAIAFVGALCYAELATTYPSAGGDYHFLARAFGRRLAFLFAWSRMTVMQTGSIALLAYVFGDYATELAPLGPYSPALYAALVIVLFTAINVLGIRQGARTQAVFTTVEVAGIVGLSLVGLWFGTDGFGDAGVATATAAEAAREAASAAAAADPGAAADTIASAAAGESPPNAASSASLGLALVFVLLTYGGWNEAAYISAEVRGSRSAIARALLGGIVAITALYLLINVAYLQVLGHEGMAASTAVAADLMRAVAGEPGVAVVAALVAVAALTSVNATIITGARSNYALGRDFPALRFLGGWNGASGTPTHALLVQGAIAIALVALGAATRTGFATLVEYTAPVFWAFFLLTGVALFQLRRKDPQRERPFRVPAYPLVPLVFCGTSAWMLWSSLAYSGLGALAGVAMLAAGVPVLAYALSHERRTQWRDAAADADP